MENENKFFYYTCPICKNQFTTECHWKVYCSHACADIAWRKYSQEERLKFSHSADPFYCAFCGEYVVPLPGEFKYRYCSKRCKLKYKEWRKTWGTGHRIIKARNGVFGK